jgi:nudix motif 8
MEEEVFIPREEVEVLGECAPLPNKGCTMKVHPFVGFLKEPIEDLASIKFNEDEVQRVFTVPLQDLLNPEKRSLVQFRNSNSLYPVWKVDKENITIWGLTAFIIDGKNKGPSFFFVRHEGGTKSNNAMIATFH